MQGNTAQINKKIVNKPLFFAINKKMKNKCKNLSDSNLFNEGQIVRFDFFNINPNFALAVKVIFAVIAHKRERQREKRVRRKTLIHINIWKLALLIHILKNIVKRKAECNLT